MEIRIFLVILRFLSNFVKIDDFLVYLIFLLNFESKFPNYGKKFVKNQGYERCIKCGKTQLEIEHICIKKTD